MTHRFVIFGAVIAGGILAFHSVTPLALRFEADIASQVSRLRRATGVMDTRRCQRQWDHAVPPAYAERAVATRTTTLCYKAFSVGYSGVTRTPLWSAEHLTPEDVEEAQTFGRIDDFQPDTHLPARDRSQLQDYRGSGFDRGHMAPSADMPNPDARLESFTLANIVPQDRSMNAHLWADIEQAVRRLARKHDGIYVVTGPIFASNRPDQIGGRVAIPSSLFKAVLIPGVGTAAYVARNAPGRSVAIVSIAELTRLTGIDPFPAAPASLKATAIQLPKPWPRFRQTHRS